MSLPNEQAVSSYKKYLEDEIEKYEDIQAKCARKISLLTRKLKNPARSLLEEEKGGTRRARVASGQDVPARKSNLPGKKAEEKFFSEETKEMDLSAPSIKILVEKDNEKDESQKSGSGFGFFKK